MKSSVLKKLDKCRKTIREKDLSLVSDQGLDNIKDVLVMCSDEKIYGAFVETGVWNGGACIWARSVMDALGNTYPVYGCDSFEGLPKPTYPQDSGDTHHSIPQLSISIETVKENIKSFKLEGEICLVEGWFKDTMPVLKKIIEPIAVLRLDGDMYESTAQVLENLYDNVVSRGFVIIDDWCLKGARQAVSDFMKKNNINVDILKIDGCISQFQKP